MVTDQATRPAVANDAGRISGNAAGADRTRPQAQIEVHVIEDHPLYRLALCGVIDDAPQMRVGLAVASVEEFAGARPVAGNAGSRATGGAQRTVAVLDLRLPGLSDAAAVSAVVRMGFRVLVLSAHSSQPQVVSAISAGAKGYLTKDAGAEEVRRAVREVAAGNSYVSPALAGYLLDSARGRPGPVPPPLSERERQVLALLAAGERDQDIAVRLSISLRTVRSHLDRIREKTGRRRRPDLTRFAIEEGVVGPSWR